MSIHSSLRGSAATGKHRNVLRRIERIEKLEEQSRWREDQNSIMGLPKVRSIKVAVKKKKKEKAAEGAEGEAAAAPTAAAPAAKPAAKAAAKK